MLSSFGKHLNRRTEHLSHQSLRAKRMKSAMYPISRRMKYSCCPIHFADLCLAQRNNRALLCGGQRRPWPALCSHARHSEHARAVLPDRRSSSHEKAHQAFASVPGWSEQTGTQSVFGFQRRQMARFAMRRPRPASPFHAIRAHSATYRAHSIVETRKR